MSLHATTTIPASTDGNKGDQCVELRDIDWKGYSLLLKLRGDRVFPRIIYLDGTVYLMSPAFVHERVKERLGIFVIEVVVGLDIPCVPSGATTFRRRSKRGGVEGDQTFYLANEARIRGKQQIRLQTDPPPDLALEAVFPHGAKAALEVYRRLGVPEVWFATETSFQILVLQDNGRYARSDTSAAFPFLKAEEIADWIQRPQTTSETEWIKALRRWVREVLLPRVDLGPNRTP